MSTKPLSISVTGASGFLGKHVVTFLRSKGFMVIPFSRKASPEVIKIDDYSHIPAADFLVHLAESSDRTVVNSEGKSHICANCKTLEALAKKYRGRLIYASSSVVYGDKGYTPFDTSNETFATDIYSAGKLECESIVNFADGLIMRISNVYGKGMSAQNVFQTILSQLGNDGPLTVRNEFPIRDYISVDDILELLFLALSNYQTGTYNVGTGSGISVRKLAETILSVAGQEGREIHSLERNNQFSSSILNISHTVEIFNWKPRTQIKVYMRDKLF